jgi:hypothetical protein
VVSAHNRQLEAKLSPLVKEIVEFPARTKADFEFLYGRVVTAVILRSGLGNPTNRGVERETNLVLQSVFPLQALQAFVTQSRMDKRTQLRELTAVVTGIRKRSDAITKNSITFYAWKCGPTWSGYLDIRAE